VERAAAIAVDAVSCFLETHPNEIEVVEWVLFDDYTFQVYQDAIARSKH
jgi:O-acetyl-ADP-ribose deacetylase (regulator of RNase III)